MQIVTTSSVKFQKLTQHLNDHFISYM